MPVASSSSMKRKAKSSMTSREAANVLIDLGRVAAEKNNRVVMDDAIDLTLDSPDVFLCQPVGEIPHQGDCSGCTDCPGGCGQVDEQDLQTFCLPVAYEEVEEDEESPVDDDHTPSNTKSNSAGDLSMLICGIISSLLDGKLPEDLLMEAIAVRSLSEGMTPDQLQQVKVGIIATLYKDHDAGKHGEIPKSAIDEVATKIQSAEPGQIFHIFQYLCNAPAGRYGPGEISLAAGTTYPAGFDPDACPSTRVQAVFDKHIPENQRIKMNVRWSCEREKPDPNDGYEPCKKTTEEEGEAVSCVENLLAIFFFMIGGNINFFNLGGTSTLIKEKVASKLVRRFFRHFVPSGYHGSLFCYVNRFMGPFENQTPKTTKNSRRRSAG